MLPWFLRVYLHTVRVTDQKGEKIAIERSHFQPGRDRLHPHQIELIFTIPPRTTVEFGVDFDLTLLKWTEYPPDAHRGFDVAPAVIAAKFDADQCGDFIFPTKFSQLRGGKNGACFLRLYTESLLVSLPTPDFSMPYNVICMTCTVLALAFGPIHALTTKNFSLVDPAANPTGVEVVKRKVMALVGRFRKTAVVVAPAVDENETHDVDDERDGGEWILSFTPFTTWSLLFVQNFLGLFFWRIFSPEEYHWFLMDLSSSRCSIVGRKVSSSKWALLQQRFLILTLNHWHSNKGTHVTWFQDYPRMGKWKTHFKINWPTNRFHAFSRHQLIGNLPVPAIISIPWDRLQGPQVLRTLNPPNLLEGRNHTKPTIRNRLWAFPWEKAGRLGTQCSLI